MSVRQFKQRQRLEDFRYLVLAAQRAGNRCLGDLLKPWGITPSQAEVLRVLADHGPLTLAGIGAMLVCEPGSPSRILSGLINRGLVHRGAGAADRRTIDLSLTDAGRAVEARVRAAEDELHDQLARIAEAEEVTVASALLRRVIAGTPHGDALALRDKAREGD